MEEHFAYIKNERHSESSPLNLFTDACAAGSKGYGAIFGKHWFTVRGLIRGNPYF